MADGRGDYGSRYLRHRETYGHVAWLRLVTRHSRSPQMQWEATIRGNDIVYGPLSTEGGTSDFAKHARDVDARLIALGYFIEDEGAA